MKDHNHDIELIEKFLGDKMTMEETKLFEEKKINDPAFAGILKDMDLLIAGVRHSAARTSKEEKADRLKFYTEILEMEERSWREEPMVVYRMRVIPMYQKAGLIAAAAGLLLLLVFGIFSLQNKTPLNDKLYAAYFEPFDSPGSGLTRGTNEVTLKTQAYEAYDNGQYAEAIAKFGEILKNSDDPVIHLCLGNAQLKEGLLPQAEITFNHILARHDGDLLTQAKWYLALTYLKQNNVEGCKANLWQIRDSSTYGEKARKLLKELD